MGTGTGAGAAPDRAKQRRASAGGHLWKKALLHFSLCFVMGFFTGFAPSSPSSSWKAATTHPPHRLAASRVAVDVDVDARTSLVPPADALSSSSSVATVDAGDDAAEGGQRRLLIVVTTTRHLAFRPEGNLTAAGEAHAQRNAALAHVERHRLAGVLHFADAAAVYDVGFFDQIRQIESVPPPPPTPSAPFLRFYRRRAFGAWPVATVSAGEKKVTVEGPLCSASEVVGWFSRDLDDDGTTRSVAYDRREADLDPAAAGTRARTTTIGVSGFAFNSSILWDPERWGRPASLPDTSQDSIKFVQEVVLEDRAKLS
ncbi:putative beta-14-xylosyltransferase IRX9 [Zea mays]|uniref:Glycosyltransferases n=1 Tax=Zea mays TaxID=4577 RepID=A0A1D6LGV0_MAIZE|nr:putative beta-14-xylosyltransferase IRX9 [Zea mays]